ncbi:MAG TPA: OmpA family protein [Pyrinomonadaceae bacterium]|nr:OmpA family protein [Pyrinomonadaceae bacterium]
MKPLISRVVAAAAILFCSSAAALSQSDATRTTLAITYPLDQTIEVPFHGTTRLPRLKGTATVRRQGRRGTRVTLSIENLPRAYELGSIYTTYVLWAISPDGHVDNMGEIKRSGSGLVDSKIDVTTPLQTFALLVTAEPHFLVHAPSRMVVMENLAPRRPKNSELETATIQYIGNTSDYFRDPSVPPIAQTDFREIPVALLGARQAINLARYAGAERDAVNEYRAAQADLEQAESAFRMRQPDREIDILARQAISSGAKAEDMAVVRRTARERREELERRDAAVRSAERSVDTANQQISQLQKELDNERHARELAERDAVSATEQLRDARTEVARLRDELRTTREEAEDAKVRVARMEGEKQAEQARLAADKRAADLKAAAENLKQSLSRFLTVHDSNRGMTLVLSEPLWVSPRSAKLAPSSAAKLDQIGALLANNPDYQITIESYTDNSGDAAALEQLTQDRARVLSERLVSAGVDVTRIQANGMGSANPIAPNTTLASRAKNRRTEITLALSGTQ